jgi:hypothetical protein
VTVPYKTDYKIGDRCWLKLPGVPNLQEGIVVAAVGLPNHTVPYFLIQVSNYNWPTLEVRDALLLSDTGVSLAPRFRGVSVSV